MRAAAARGTEMGLSDDELAFYDALETNDSAVKVFGELPLPRGERGHDDDSPADQLPGRVGSVLTC